MSIFKSVSVASTQSDTSLDEAGDLPFLTARSSPSIENIEAVRLDLSSNSGLYELPDHSVSLREAKDVNSTKTEIPDSCVSSYSSDDTRTALEIGTPARQEITTTPKRDATARASTPASGWRRGRAGATPPSPHSMFFPPPPAAVFGYASTFRNMSFRTPHMRPFDTYGTVYGLPPMAPPPPPCMYSRPMGVRPLPPPVFSPTRSPPTPRTALPRIFPEQRNERYESRSPMPMTPKPFRSLPEHTLPRKASSASPPLSASSPPASNASPAASPERSSTVVASPSSELVPYPLVYVSPAGSISCMLNYEVVVEMTVDRSIRVVLHDGFAAMTNARGTTSAIIHPNGKIMNIEEQVYSKFVSNNEKLSVFGGPGVLFTMSHLSEAYLVNSAIYRGATAVPLEQLRIPAMDDDFTLRLFYLESQTGKQFMALCKDIVSEATYDRRPDGSLYLHINGMLIRQSATGDVTVDSKPRHISCSPTLKTVQVRTGSIDMAVEENERGYVKKGSKRVHVSRSGMVVSDGNCITSMDHFGRIICCT